MCTQHTRTHTRTHALFTMLIFPLFLSPLVSSVLMSSECWLDRMNIQTGWKDRRLAIHHLLSHHPILLVRRDGIEEESELDWSPQIQKGRSATKTRGDRAILPLALNYFNFNSSGQLAMTRGKKGVRKRESQPGEMWDGWRGHHWAFFPPHLVKVKTRGQSQRSFYEAYRRERWHEERSETG